MGWVGLGADFLKSFLVGWVGSGWVQIFQILLGWIGWGWVGLGPEINIAGAADG